MAGAPPLNGTSVGFAPTIELSNRQVVKKIEPTPACAWLSVPELAFRCATNSFRSFGREVLPRRDDDRKRGDHADRLEIVIGPVGQVRIQRDRGGVRPHLPHQDGVTVGVGAHRPGRTDGAAGARDVLHDDLLTERARHVIGDDAGGDVGGAAGRKRHDERDRASRPGLPACDPRGEWNCGSARCQMQKSAALEFHGVPLTDRRSSSVAHAVKNVCRRPATRSASTLGRHLALQQQSRF